MSADSVSELVEQGRHLLEESTPGPWQCWNAFKLSERSPLLGIARIGPSGADGGGGILGNPDGRGADLYATEADAQLVAFAVSHLPALLDALEAAQQENERLTRAEAMLSRACSRYEDERSKEEPPNV